MAKGRSNKVTATDILNTISHGTGTLCKKVAGLRKVTNTPTWKKMMRTTKDICETVGEKAEVVLDKVVHTVERGTRDIGASFQAGMESVAEGQGAHKASGVSKKKVAGKGKSKSKSPARKAKIDAAIAEAAPANADIEKEIDAVTENVTIVQDASAPQEVKGE